MVPVAEERPSKSARKRAAQAIRAIADELVALKPAQVAGISDNEDVVRAVREAQAIGAHGALRRQKQYIAKLLREEDIEPIRAALDALGGDPITQKRVFRQAEQLRDALTGSAHAEALGLAQAAGVDTGGEFAALIARYHAAADDDARRAAARKLFRAIHAQLAAAART